MRRAQYEPFTEVIIHWVDAAGAASDTYVSVKDALESFKPARRKTLGYFLGYAKKDGETALLIATDDDRTPDIPEACGAVFNCPVTLIRDIEVVKAVPKRKKRR